MCKCRLPAWFQISRSANAFRLLYVSTPITVNEFQLCSVHLLNIIHMNVAMLMLLILSYSYCCCKCMHDAP